MMHYYYISLFNALLLIDAERKNKPVELLYAVPAECEGLSRITYTIDASDCKVLWDRSVRISVSLYIFMDLCVLCSVYILSTFFVTDIFSTACITYFLVNLLLKSSLFCHGKLFLVLNINTLRWCFAPLVWKDHCLTFCFIVAIFVHSDSRKIYFHTFFLIFYAVAMGNGGHSKNKQQYFVKP